MLVGGFLNLSRHQSEVFYFGSCHQPSYSVSKRITGTFQSNLVKINRSMQNINEMRSVNAEIDSQSLHGRTIKHAYPKKKEAFLLQQADNILDTLDVELMFTEESATREK